MAMCHLSATHHHRRLSDAEEVDTGYERTRYEALLDLDYAITVSSLNDCFYRAVKQWIGIIRLMASSGAVFAIMGTSKPLMLGLGLAVAFLSAIDLISDPGKKAAEHLKDKQQFLDLSSRVSDLDCMQIDSEMSKIRKDAAPVIRALCRPAFNNNLRSAGRQEHCVTLSKWESFVYWWT